MKKNFKKLSANSEILCCERTNKQTNERMNERTNRAAKFIEHFSYRGCPKSKASSKTVLLHLEQLFGTKL